MTAARLAARAGPVLRRRRLALVVGWAASFLAVFVALLALTHRPPATHVGELAANGGFESGLAPWLPYGDGRLELVRPGRTGAASGAAVAEAHDHYGFVWPDAVIRPAVGDRFVLTAWVRGAGSGVYLGLDERAGTETHSIGDRDLALTRRWRRLSVAGVVRTPNRDAVDAYIYLHRARAVGETLYLDDVSLIPLETKASASG